MGGLAQIVQNPLVWRLVFTASVLARSVSVKMAGVDLVVTSVPATQTTLAVATVSVIIMSVGVTRVSRGVLVLRLCVPMIAASTAPATHTMISANVMLDGWEQIVHYLRALFNAAMRASALVTVFAWMRVCVIATKAGKVLDVIDWRAHTTVMDGVCVVRAMSANVSKATVANFAKLRFVPTIVLDMVTAWHLECAVVPPRSLEPIVR